VVTLVLALVSPLLMAASLVTLTLAIRRRSWRLSAATVVLGFTTSAIGAVRLFS
jgi:hypothetical protein